MKNGMDTERKIMINDKGTSNNYQFVAPQMRKSSDVRSCWIPAIAGMTFLEVAIKV